MVQFQAQTNFAIVPASSNFDAQYDKSQKLFKNNHLLHKSDSLNHAVFLAFLRMLDQYHNL